MIAKITRGTRVGDIAAYLHGPGKADEHQYVKDGQRHSGGVVIASTIGAEGATDPAEWAADLRHTQQTRPPGHRWSPARSSGSVGAGPSRICNTSKECRISPGRD